MARLRYVKSPTPPAAKPAASTIRHQVTSLRALYETEPEIARAVLPQPLEPAEPHIFVQFANVEMHFSAEKIIKIGAATVGVACSHEGNAGYYVLAMPMEGEFVVIGGRERYGEPKKIAQTELTRDDTGRVNAKVTRHGITFLELEGIVGGELDAPKQFTEYFYCYKALPAASKDDSQNGGFDGEVLLTRLIWERNYDSVREIKDGKVILRESARDPLVDVPVKRVLKMELAKGASKTGGEVVRSVPGEWLAPFLCQRYDDPMPGIDVALASEVSGE